MLKSLFSKQPEKKSINIACFADTHTGSSVALHPNVRKVDGVYKPLLEIGGWKYKHNHHFYLSSAQMKIWEHLQKCLATTRDLRAGKKLIVLLAGDAKDGNHHNTPQLVSPDPFEQVETHVELMEYIRESLGYQAGDETYYITGTEVHVGDGEHAIGKQLNAHQYEDGFYSADFLEMDLNGVYTWIFHQGVSAGTHPNRGNAQRNAMKRIYYDRVATGKRVPQLIISAHTHDSNHETYSPVDGFTMHYIILPSWQDKTRYVVQKMAMVTNSVGMRNIEITGDGKLIIHEAMLYQNKRGDLVTV